MMSLEEFREAIRDVLGDSADLVRDEQLDRWVNRGRARMNIYEPKTASLTWADAATSVPLPADFGQFERLVSDSGSFLPNYTVLGTSIAFFAPDAVRAGTATLFYGANYGAVAATEASTMPALADEAAVSYALGRFYRRIAASRSDFKRYVAVTGQNGVDVRELLDLADQHDRDFEVARSELIAVAPSTFYGD